MYLGFSKPTEDEACLDYGNWMKSEFILERFAEVGGSFAIDSSKWGVFSASLNPNYVVAFGSALPSHRCVQAQTLAGVLRAAAPVPGESTGGRRGRCFHRAWGTGTKPGFTCWDTIHDMIIGINLQIQRASLHKKLSNGRHYKRANFFFLN